MNSLISVIVPVYKVEKYLEKCIKSIVNQSYQNLEIILVDDGSPDNSPQICNEWAETDERIIVIHKKNGGVSSARNVALEQCCGEYIMFVDSDDYIDENAVEVLYNHIIDNQADIVACNFRYVSSDYEFIKNSSYCEKHLIGNEDILINYFEDDFIDPCACCKLYSRRVIGVVRFDEAVKNGEDFLFNYGCLTRAENVFQTEDILYNYVQLDNSATHVVSASLICRWKNTKSLLNRIDEKTVHEQCFNKYSRELFSCLKELLKSNDHELIALCYDDITDEIILSSKKIFASDISPVNKIYLLIIIINKNLFKNLYLGLNKKWKR